MMEWFWLLIPTTVWSALVYLACVVGLLIWLFILEWKYYGKKFELERWKEHYGEERRRRT